MKKGIGWIGALALCLLLGGKPSVAINPGDIIGGAKDAVDLVQAFAINDKQEVKIGTQLHPRLLAEMGGEYSDAGLKNYVNRIGQRLVKVSGRSNIPYHFTVVNTPMVNAFAIPGGYVYVTKGIMKVLRDEAELASVLGHEIGHVVGKHGVNKIRQVVVAQKAMKYVDRLGEVALSQMTNLFMNMWVSGYGRQQELEADRMGLHMANNASYDPHGAVRLFQHLLEQEKGSGGDIFNSLFASHPPTKKRIELAEKEIKMLSKRGTQTNKGQYLAIRKRLGR